jgi:menaquinone-dependent protoporphyrinogen oxidase
MRLNIYFATREGQTARIAQHVAAQLLARGVQIELRDVAGLAKDVPVAADAAILAASIHLGNHEREMVRFVRDHRAALEQIPCAFVSVSMSEAGVEDGARPLEMRQQMAANVRRSIDAFLAKTGWHPQRVLPVAGALAYTRYNPLVRFVMKRIARREGSSTDTSCDHEYTDWAALDRFVDAFLRELDAREQKMVAS